MTTAKQSPPQAAKQGKSSQDLQPSTAREDTESNGRPARFSATDDAHDRTSQGPVAAAERDRSLKDDGRDTRREQILDSAAEMFAEYGYHGASLRNISRRAGLSHPGMLHYFASKAILLDAVIDRMEAYVQEALDRVDDFCSDPSALQRGLAEVWHPSSQPIQLLATLDAEVVSKDHPGRFRMARLRRVHEHVLEQCFVTFDERGLLREYIDPAFASRALFALVLNSAVREETVRAMQNDPHDDSPMKDLLRLAQAFLKPAATGGTP